MLSITWLMMASMIFSVENDGFSAIFTHNNKKLNRQKSYKRLYVYRSFFFLTDTEKRKVYNFVLCKLVIFLFIRRQLHELA